MKLTNTDKWKDDWFLSLSPRTKLVFIYLYENCDEAGFYKINDKFISYQLQVEAKDIMKSIKLMAKAIIFNLDRSKIWIKNYLFHQLKLPLIDSNIEHKRIKMILKKNLKDFNYNEDILFILENIEYNNTSNKKSRKLFKKPTIKEYEEYALEYAESKKISIKKDWAKNLYDYYESNGWKIGGKTPMKDWKASIRNAFYRNENNNGISNKSSPYHKKSKIETITSANDYICDVKTE